jgi:hypothetical protein
MISAITPQLMLASAKLKMGEKNIKWLPPMYGNHDGQFHSTSGK